MTGFIFTGLALVRLLSYFMKFHTAVPLNSFFTVSYYIILMLWECSHFPIAIFRHTR